MNKICPTCKKEFIATSQSKFCSVDCRVKSPKRLAHLAKMRSCIKNFSKSEEQRRKISDSLKGSHHTLETRKKMSRTRKGVPKKPEHVEKIREAINQRVEKGTHKFPVSPRGKRSHYISTKTGRKEFSDSSYELRRFKALDASPLVKFWTKKHKIRIRYHDGFRKRWYLPDILVEFNSGKKIIEEVKGHVFEPFKFESKNFAAQKYCALNGMHFRIIYFKDLDKVV